MKKLAISLITMGMVSFGFAQNSYPDFDLSKFRDFVTIGSNYEYLNDVQNGLTPNQVKYLEDLVSYWDVTQAEKFDSRRGEPFNVTFMLEYGHITASYDSKGKIVSAMERFSDFAIPKSVGNEVLRQYPDWKIVKNRYSVWYGQNDRTKRIFKLLIRKGNQKKWLKVDSSGGISLSSFTKINWLGGWR